MANNIFKKKDIKLDTFENLNEEMIASFSQGDRVSDKLLISLTNDGVPLDLTDATKVRIDFRKPDGHLVFQYCTMEDKPKGLISAILTTQTLAAPGEVYAEVTVQYPDGKDAVTRQFTFWVQDAIASDKSLESTNEFPMLERAIVAGDMLAGVDLVAIIQAGQLAAAALPKTGGTMTGNITFQTDGGPKALQWYNGANIAGRMLMHSSGLAEFQGYQGATAKTAWNYTSSTDTFNVHASNTNLLKKTGDTMTGHLYREIGTSGDSRIAWTKDDALLWGFTSSQGALNFHDWKANKVVWNYDQANYKLNMIADTNLLKKTGDTMTGALTMQNDILFDGSRQIASKTSTGQLVFGNSGVWLGDANGGSIPWNYRYSDKMFIINSRAQLGLVDATAHINMSSNSQINYNQLTTTSSAKGMMFTDDASTTVMAGLGRFRDATRDYTYMGWGTQPWLVANNLTVNSSQFTYKNYAITTAEKDGTETPTVSNAASPDPNYLLQAIRRGNTVMLKGAVTVDAAATNLTVATLSANYRPAGGHNVRTYLTPNAGGTPAELFINGTTGAIAFNDKAKGNRIDFCITYVVN